MLLGLRTTRFGAPLLNQRRTMTGRETTLWKPTLLTLPVNHFLYFISSSRSIPPSSFLRYPSSRGLYNGVTSRHYTLNARCCHWWQRLYSSQSCPVVSWVLLLSGSGVISNSVGSIVYLVFVYLFIITVTSRFSDCVESTVNLVALFYLFIYLFIFNYCDKL